MNIDEKISNNWYLDQDDIQTLIKRYRIMKYIIAILSVAVLVLIVGCQPPTAVKNDCPELSNNIAPNTAISEGIYKSEGVFTITTIHFYGANTPLLNTGHEIQTDKKINSKKNYVYHIEHVQMLDSNGKWEIKKLICIRN